MEITVKKKKLNYHRTTRRTKESGRKREVVGVGVYQGQEQLRSPTPASAGSRAVGGQYLAESSLQRPQPASS